MLDETETGNYLAMIEGEERRGAPAPDAPAPARDESGDQDGARDPQPAVAMDTE